MSGIGLFIDGANLTIEWRRFSPAQLDFRKLRAYIEDHCGDKIIEAYCFDATEDGRNNAYFSAIQRSGIRVKLYRYSYESVYDSNHQLIRDATGAPIKQRRQKGVDVGLATKMLDSHRRRGWSKLVLAAADSDFAEPVQELVEVHNVDVSILGIAEKISNTLSAYSVDMIDLRAIAERVKRNPPPSLSIVGTVAAPAPA